MKKQYIRPEMIIIEFESYPMLSTSIGVHGDSQGDFKKDFVGEHRGIWGDLWGKSE